MKFEIKSHKSHEITAELAKSKAKKNKLTEDSKDCGER